MKFKNLLFLVLNACLVSSIARAQYNHFEKISEADGLSDNRVTCFMKDNTGFMWIGTENGLNRYDGYSFRIYKPGQPRFRLSHEHINHIAEDPKGRLWISTWNGLNVLDPLNDSLRIFLPDGSFEQKKSRLSSALIWSCYAEPSGKIWIAPDARDLCSFDEKTNLFTYYPWRDYVKQVFPEIGNRYASIHKIVAWGNDRLWLGTTLGLFSFDIQQKKFNYHGGDSPEDCVSLYFDQEKQIVVFSQINIYAYHVKTDQLLTLNSNLRTGTIQNLRNTKLIPTTDGLFALHKTEGWIQRAKIDQKTAFTLHHEKTEVVFEDEGALWIGAADGIRYLDSKLERFQFTAVFPDTLRSDAGNAHHILEEKNGTHYFISAYTQHQLIILDKLTGAQRVIKKIENKPLIQCSKTFEDRNGRLWVLTRDYLFFSDDHQNFRVFTPPGEDSYHFMDMTEDADGNFWFAAMRYGVYCYRPKTKHWFFVRDEHEELYACRPTVLQSDSVNRTVWVGDYSFGVFQCHLDSLKYRYFGTDETDSTSLHSSLINSLSLDQVGNMWVATSAAGIACYRRTNGTFKNFGMIDGIPENTISYMINDHHNDLWLASFKGITRLSSDGKVRTHYDLNHGLPFTGFNTPFSKKTNGEIMIGIANGFISFHPDSLNLTSDDFPIVIHDMKLGNQSRSLLQTHHFDYDEHEFTFEFSALTYTLPHQVTYYYQLEGYDKEWIDAGNRHTAHYTNLENGNYTFRVRAIDYSGKTSLNTAYVEFMISPPFWRTPYFYAIVALATISILYFWWRTLQRKIRAQKILREVATSLYNQNTLEGVFWTVARNCVDLLHFEDCVIYFLDPESGVLIQKAAAGPKSTTPYQIQEPIEIPIGLGIVGTVAKTGKAEIISNTAKDPRYIVDDVRRLSEISVPIYVDGKIFGVIDSEHSRKGYFNRWHLTMLEEITKICSTKIGRYFAEDQIRSKVARDLHDDMGSTLSSIKIMSNIALEKNEPAVALNYLKTIRQNATAMQESMSDMVWAINPENDSLEQVIIRMKEFSAEILEPLDIQYAFYEDGDFSRVKLDLNTRKDFYLIFKEALNNAAKYSRCTAVLIHLRHDSRGISLSVEDNGQGFDHHIVSNGNGLRNMRHRAQHIGGVITVQSTPGKGTLVKLDIQSHEQVIEQDGKKIIFRDGN